MKWDHLVVQHCAPTLAGIKMGALISLSKEESGEEYEQVIQAYNDRCVHTTLRFADVCSCKRRRLLYIYRPSQVEAYIQRPETAEFLVQFGYDPSMDLEHALNRLRDRFRKSGEFPHELGIFLGYPLEDVKSFIARKGEGAKLVGEWKVYVDVDTAAREFQRYAACRGDYIQRFAQGAALEELIVA